MVPLWRFEGIDLIHPDDGRLPGRMGTVIEDVTNPQVRPPSRVISWGLFGDFQACPRDFSGTFRRVSREGPDSAER
jgi:hypothetical protein